MTTNLTTQYRSESLDIVELYTKFVDYLRGVNCQDLTTPYSENVRPFSLKHFAKGDRLLAYTNEAVGRWNQLIAKQLGIEGYIGQEVQLGNKLDTVLVKKLIDPNRSELVVWFDSNVLKLQNSQINRRFLDSSLQALIDNKNIEFIESMEGKIYPVIIGIGKANKILKKAKENAVTNRKKFKEVYALGRAYIMDYNFATTVHKSQGSEFRHVFIDKQDIQKSIIHRYYMTYARLMYVACSRACNKIYI